LYFLQKERDAVVDSLDGLDDAQVRTAGVPSGTSLLGIVQHLTGAEAHWFEVVFLGRPERAREKSMSVPPDADVAAIVDEYRAVWARSDEIVNACADLGTLAAALNPGENDHYPLRVILAHMIEETARHAGHADILREHIDGRTANVV
jgi:hypothetical protein